MARVLVFIFLIAILYFLSGLDSNVINQEILYFGTLSIVLLVSYYMSDLFRKFKFSFRVLIILVPLIIGNYFMPFTIENIMASDFFNFLGIGVFAFFIAISSSLKNSKSLILSSSFNYLIRLVVLIFFLLFLSKQDNYYINLFSENYFLLALILVSPAPFIFLFSDVESRFIKAPIIRQYINRSFIFVLFTLSIFFLLIFIKGDIVNSNISVLVFNSLLCSVVIASILILYSIKYKSDLFFLLLVSVLVMFVINKSDYILDPFITFFFAGIMVNFKSDLSSELRKVEKNFIEIFQIYLLTFFLLNVKVDIALLPYSLLLVVVSIVLVLVTSRFEKFFFKSNNHKIEYLKYAALAQGIVSFYILSLIQNYFSLDKDLISILQLTISINAFLGLIYFEYGRLKYNEQFSDQHSEKELESLLGMENLESDILPDCKNLNKYLKEFKEYYKKKLDETIIEISRENHKEVLHLAKHYFEEYKTVFDKFSKELGIIKYGDIELSKEKVRENRNLLTQKFYSFSVEAEDRLKAINELEQCSKKLIEDLEKKIIAFPRIFELERFFDISIKKNDRFFIRFYKRIKKSLNKILFLILPENKVQREIYLKEILIFHLYQRYVTATRVYQNQYFHHFFMMVKHFHNLYKEMDQQFVSFFNFIEETYEDQEMYEKYQHVFDEFLNESEVDYNEAILNIERSLENSLEILEKGYRSMMQYSYKDFATSGTVLYSKRKHRLSKVYNQYQHDLKFLEYNNNNWNRIIRSYIGHTCIDLDIKLLQNKVRKILNHSIYQFSSHVHTYIKALVQSLSSYLENQFRELGKQIVKPENLDIHYLNDFKKRIAYQSKINTEKSIENLRYSKKLNQYIHEIIGNIHESVNEIPVSYKVGLSKVHTIHHGEYPKEIVLEKVPLRDISRNYLELEVTKVLGDLNNQISVGIDNLLQILSENRLKVNDDFEQYIRDFEIGKIDAKNLKESVLNTEKGSVKKLKEGIEFIDSVNESISNTIIREVVKKTQDLKTQTISRIDHIILDIYQKNRDENDENLRNEIFDKLEDIKSFFLTLYKKIFESFKSYKEEFESEFIDQYGIEAVDYDYFHIEEKDFSNIPFMYRKLLSLDPLEIKDLMLYREEELEIIDQSLIRWKNGNNCNILVVGSMGTGKTSFVNCVNKYKLNNENHFRYKINKQYKNEEELVIDLGQVLGISEQIKTLDALVEKISLNKIKTILILESVHMLFKRELGGFELFISFHNFMNRSSENILWINTVSTGSYEFLSSQSLIDDYYSYVINVHPFKKEELETLFRQRNKMSGFDIEFMDNNLTKKEVKEFRKLKNEQSQIFLEKKYFQNLYDISEGNIYNAIFHWLKSLNIEGDNKLYVKQISLKFDHLFKQLDTRKLLVLQCLFIQGYLQADDLAIQLNSSLESILKELNFLRNKNLVNRIQSEKFEVYTINKIAFIPIRKFLSKNLVLV